MEKYLFVLLLFFYLFSCKEDNTLKEGVEKTKNQLVIDLKLHKEKGPLGTTISPFSLVDSLPSGFKGIPNYSYSSFQSLNLNSSKNFEKAIIEGKIDSSQAIALKSKIYAISAIEEDKQIIILDMNQNHDFGDDKVYTYDASLRSETAKNKELRDSFPFIHFKYKRYYNKKIRDRERYARLMPYKDYFSSIKPPTKAQQRYFDLTLTIVQNQYREGFFDIDSSSFKIAVKFYNEDFDFVFRKQDKQYYKNESSQYEEFKRGDTIQLGNRFIGIDSLGADLDKVYLSKLNITALPNPYKKNQVIRDYEFTTMDGKIQKISDLLKDKDYVLIDFWGTWCGPCLALTEDLKAFHNKNLDVAMVSVDFDFKKEPGVAYIKEKGLSDWTHIFVERVRNDSLLKTKLVSKLKINNYPTFILLDKDRKIIHRAIGKEGLWETIAVLLSIKAAKKEARKTIKE